MRLVALFCLLLAAAPGAAAEPVPLLFLGDNGSHAPAARFRQLEPELAKRGFRLTYTDKLGDLNPATLARHAGLVIYANHAAISPDQEAALLGYVENGGGLVALHCASFCFLNSPKYVALVGAQFRAHQTGVFRVERPEPTHPVVRGIDPFESWDETYTHHKHNPLDRTVLETRREGEVAEPWTWARTQGKGRVFYTAWGHDHRTFSHPGFHALVERGARYACGLPLDGATNYVDAPKMTAITAPETDFTFQPAKVPFYPAGKKWGTTTDPIGKMPLPLSPEKEQPHYSVPEGFKLELFAADADFQGGKPIATAWDERGRLWACVTVDYPNSMKKPGEGRDKIVILEDTDGDGRADKFTLFADKLSIPTSLAFAFGGVVVHQAPVTLFLKDTDGDGKADLRQELFTGWGTKDTHAGPSNLRYHFDNTYVGMCGYSGFDGSVGGEKVRFGQGIYALKLEREPGDAHKLRAAKLEFLRSTNNNNWGVGQTETGDLVGSTANGCPLVHLTIPNRYYEATPGLSAGPLASIALDNRYHPVTDKVRQVDWHGGFTSAAGCGVYTARTYPKEYWNSAAFVCDPTGHLSAAFQLMPSGASYVGRYGWNLAAADDEWAAPIDAQVGPDGTVWLLDWYNYIVQHNPTPAGFTTGAGNAYETPLRDQKRGRIWRVVATNGKPTPKPTLSGATPDQLLAALSTPSLPWRLHAQRLLCERGQADVVPALQKLAVADARDELGLAPAALHAVHLIAALGGPEAVPAGAATHPVPAVRRAAAERGATKVALDADPAVRLAQLLALGRIESSGDAATALASVLGQFAATEPAERDAWVVAAARHAEPLAARLGAAMTPAQAGAVRATYRAAASRDPAVAARLIATPLDAAARTAVFAGLTEGLPKGKKLPLSDAAKVAFAALVKSAAPAERVGLFRLADRLDVSGLEAELGAAVAALLKGAADPAAPTAARLDAAAQAVMLRPADDAVALQLADLLGAGADPDFAAGLLKALAQSRSAKLDAAVVAKLPALAGAARKQAVQLVLARPEPTRLFLDAVEARKVRFDLLALDQKDGLAKHPDAAIAGRARKLLALGGGLPDANRQAVIDKITPELAKLSPDAVHGKAVFATHCAKCHQHGDAGNNIGPNLTGMAGHPAEELLIAILDPSRSVEGNYRSYTARTLDGRVLTGLLAAETKAAVELVDAENVRHALRRDDLEELVESTKSLMPEGFETQMPPQDLGDLVAYLVAAGKFVPLPLEKVATADATRGLFFSKENPAEALRLPDYKARTLNGVPFALVEPADSKPNAVYLYGPQGYLAPTMPRSVSVPVGRAAKAIHLLGGVGGWAYPASEKGSVSLTVRLHYAGGATEDHNLVNGTHIADYIRRVDVPGSAFALDVNGRQLRTLSVRPKSPAVIERVELIKGPDGTAPLVFALTAELP